MSCICERNNPPQVYYPLNQQKTVTYTDLYWLYSENGGPNISKKVTELIDLYLRVSYPQLWETNKSGSYHKRIFHCPLCNRFFPPINKYEKELYEKG